ncbi:MAG: hypothetical protein HY903_23210 [Deltaproteobacteria bacterium]|nr:hypothetical protein [Deltaproteobacteria bacterium]
MTRINESRPDVAREIVRHEAGKRPLDLKKSAPDKAGSVRGEQPGDQVDRSGAPRGTTAAVADVAGATPAAAQFGALVAGRMPADVAPRVLGDGVGVDRDLAPDAKVLGRLNELESAAAKLGDAKSGLKEALLAAAAKIRGGLMLTLADGVGAHVGDKTQVPRPLVASAAEGMMAAKDEAKMLQAMQGALYAQKAHFPLGMDINAFVQAVLRESYLLQNEILKDYADKVKFYNDMKRKIRDKLKVARDLQIALKDGGDVPAYLWWVDPKSGDESNYRDQSGVEGLEAAESAQGTGGAENDKTTGPGDDTPTVEVSATFFEAGSTFPPPATADGVLALQRLCGFLRDQGGSGVGAADLWKMMSAIWQGNDKGVAPYADNAGAARARSFFFDIPGWSSTWNGGNDMMVAFADCLAKNVSQLSDADAAVLVQTMAEANLDGKRGGDAGKEGGSRIFLAFLAEHMTDGQLESLKAGSSPQVWNTFQEAARVDASANAKSPMDLTGRIRKWADAYDSLPDVLKTDPLSEVGRLYAEVLVHGAPGAAADMLAAKLRSMPTKDVQAFASAMVAASGGLDLGKTIFGEGNLEVTPPSAPSAGDPPPTSTPSSGGSGAGAGDVSGQPADRGAYVEAYVKGLEETLQGAGEDAQLANVDLQNALQQQQQMLQMLSNVSKMLHDTAMSIIRKIGG